MAPNRLVTITFYCKEQKPKVRAGKMVQQSKVLAAHKPDHIEFFPHFFFYFLSVDVISTITQNILGEKKAHFGLQVTDHH